MLFPVFKRPTLPPLNTGMRLMCLAVTLAMCGAAGAQTSVQTDQRADQQPPATATPVVVTLQDAIKRAQAAEPSFANSLANARIAGLDKSIARAGLLPSARVIGQGLYVQPN